MHKSAPVSIRKLNFYEPYLFRERVVVLHGVVHNMVLFLLATSNIIWKTQKVVVNRPNTVAALSNQVRQPWPVLLTRQIPDDVPPRHKLLLPPHCNRKKIDHHLIPK
ncbi:Hypothetical predicted protein [Cloeon dipterum]|uniref:Uncharacterized protein n=1 Tax=Cloeon dipterum TaxID=197152 RepID=A0A8S1DX16_9INSE|nr:Hypothetical predicted protein [Cloeon dipterum]